MRRVVFALVLVLAGCGNPLRDLAVETCDDLEDSIVLTAALVVSDAIEDAEELGFTGPELGDAMREECPDVMAALESIGEESAQEEQAADEVTLEVQSCNSDGASGTVQNRNNRTVDISIEVEFLSDSGVQIDTGFDYVQSVGSFQTAEWDAFFFGDALARCSAEIESVRFSD